MGKLIPVHAMEIVPGDRVTLGSEALLRLAPLVAPVMHKVDVYQHWFFVPNRLTWSGWEDFITGKTPSPAFPTLNGLTVDRSSLADYMGLPISSGIDSVSALPFAAYQMIYNEYYRDQNLIDEIDYKLTDGPQADNGKFNVIRKRAWQHDYFTASLPFAQKGDAVTLPLGQMSDVTVDYSPSTSNGAYFVTADGSPADPGTVGSILKPPTSNGLILRDEAGNNLVYEPNGSLVAKTSELESTASTINDLRRAFRLQEWLEKAARGGTRYVENIWANFQVKSSDARLQRPEYLGGSKQPVVISEVLQTSETTETGTPQGTMSGHGISVGGGKNFSYFAEEHGYIIGIMSVMPKTAYQQGIPKHFSKFDYLDFMWPTFATLGEQPVKNREIYYNNADSDQVNDGTWGYVPRYSEYRYTDSRVAGDFRDSLSFWHMGRIFASRPSLNKSFVECDPTTRIFAYEDITEYDSIYAHIFLRIKAVRKLPKYGTPDF